MKQLLKKWNNRMLAYRKEADESKVNIERIKAINKFFIYRECIKELKEELLNTNKH